MRKLKSTNFLIVIETTRFSYQVVFLLIMLRNTAEKLIENMFSIINTYLQDD